ncbi:sulfotransferase [Bowmanella denitrificans]|uniref:sulfotransferase n=1 Tax=Bowmanella denitrificans TaxID=366582 RepID=UPI000C9A63DD|nr:sulfotransferase [Bowmanella denitrificans]
MSTSISLITGIPRSGTTLCCKLLNQREDLVALHEPINPARLHQNLGRPGATFRVKTLIAELCQAVEQGLPFEHGDRGGLQIENPVGLVEQDGKRQVVAQRGQVILPARASGTFRLVVKQNALFTALLSGLTAEYPMTAVVRNPVDVLLSWMTVDLPVNRGRLPAGERFSPALRQSLQQVSSVFERQLMIYRWFIQQFMRHELPLVRYEDVLASGGAVLDQTMGLPPVSRPALAPQPRQFSPQVLQMLAAHRQSVVRLAELGLYSEADIVQALDNVLNPTI